MAPCMQAPNAPHMVLTSSFLETLEGSPLTICIDDSEALKAGCWPEEEHIPLLIVWDEECSLSK